MDFLPLILINEMLSSTPYGSVVVPVASGILGSHDSNVEEAAVIPDIHIVASFEKSISRRKSKKGNGLGAPLQQVQPMKRDKKVGTLGKNFPTPNIPSRSLLCRRVSKAIYWNHTLRAYSIAKL